MDNLDISRFIEAHKLSYQTALAEIRNGRKISHWMWYIFPQMKGLGHSSTSQYYSIHSLDEAAAFLHDPYLGGNLLEICHALKGVIGNLAITPLYEALSDMTEKLRSREEADYQFLYSKVIEIRSKFWKS